MKVKIKKVLSNKKVKCVIERPIAIIKERYLIYSDGIVYDCKKAEDIPIYIFKIRDILIKKI